MHETLRLGLARYLGALRGQTQETPFIKVSELDPYRPRRGVRHSRRFGRPKTAIENYLETPTSIVVPSNLVDCDRL